MDKLKMAHEYAMKHLENSNGNITIASLKSFAWEYADAMQAEADNREVKGVPESVLNSTKSSQLDLSLITHDIDCYFDNSNNTKRDADNLIQSIYEQLTGEFKATDLSEWQPDWSQAPDNADSYTKISDSEAVWWVGYPYFNGERFTDALGESYTCGYAPLFDYKGRWQDSLRKRPEGK